MFELKNYKYSCYCSDKCVSTYDNDDIVLFGINCDGDYYWINSRQNIVDNLVNFGKKEEAEEHILRNPFWVKVLFLKEIGNTDSQMALVPGLLEKIVFIKKVPYI